jgi:hypothetical protein
MAINRNIAFHRVTFDLPTEIAVAMERAVFEAGVSKKQWLADTISAAVLAANNSQKGKKK